MSDLTSNENVIDAQPVEPLDVRPPANWGFARDLRALAEFYEEHPEVAVPSGDVRLYLFPSKEEIAKYARALGKADKRVLGDSYFNLEKWFGKKVVLQVSWNREQVCDRVVVGQEEVEEEVIVSQTKELRKVTKDKVEWRCRPVLEPKEIGDGA